MINILNEVLKSQRTNILYLDSFRKAFSFLYYAALCGLIFVGFVKVIDFATGLAANTPNPVFPFVNNSELYLSVGIIEILFSFCLFRKLKRNYLPIHELAWLVLLFLFYRLGIWLFAPESNCNCGGFFLTQYFHVSKLTLDNIIFYFLVYLFSITWGVLIFNTVFRFIRRFVFAFLAASLFLSVPSFASEITFELDLKNYGFDQTRNGLTNNVSHSYIITLSSNKWAVSLLWPDGNIQTFSYDETNTFALTTFQGSKRSSGRVLTGDIPTDSYIIMVPWLAFCSGAYLRTNKVLPAPWLQPYKDEKAHIYNSDVSFVNSLEYVPSKVLWIVSDERKKAAYKSPLLIKAKNWSQAQQRKYQKYEETNSFMKAEYYVTDHRSIQNRTIPTAFIMNIYSYRNEMIGSNNAVFITRRIEGKVFRIWDAKTNSLITPEFNPNIAKGLVYVNDMRFCDNSKGIPALRYIITNKWIYDTNDFLLNTWHTNVLNKQRNRSFANRSFTRAEALYYLTLITIFAFPIIYRLFGNIIINKLKKGKT